MFYICIEIKFVSVVRIFTDSPTHTQWTYSDKSRVLLLTSTDTHLTLS